MMAQKIYRLKELRSITGYGKTQIYEMIEAGRFPRPIPLGDRAVGWLESEIDAWQKARTAKRDAKATAA
jgi:prophage regulatory protein